MSNKKYIYNPEQANFFMEQGVRCLGTGKHIQTGKVFYIFDYYECQPAYEKWNTNKK